MKIANKNYNKNGKKKNLFSNNFGSKTNFIKKLSTTQFMPYKKLLKLPKDYVYPVCGFYLVLFLYAYEIESSNQITSVIGVSLNFIIDKILAIC